MFWDSLLYFAWDRVFAGEKKKLNAGLNYNDIDQHFYFYNNSFGN